MYQYISTREGVVCVPWDFNSSIPIYLQIESMIKARIFSGEYPPGSHIPSVREIAQELAVNPNTVQKAFKDLEDSKLILTMRTSGRLVTEDIRTITQARQKDADGSVKSFLSEMGKMGFSPEDVLAALKAICEERRESGGVC